MTTTPPPSFLPLPGTPFKIHSGTMDRFAPKYEDRTITLRRLSYDMSPYFVGPVDPQRFLDTFLPLPLDSPILEICDFHSGFFSCFKASTSESQMYHNLVEAVKDVLPHLSLINTSRLTDNVRGTNQWPFSCQPDCTVMDRDHINRNPDLISQLDSSLAEFFIEFKASNHDPFAPQPGSTPSSHDPSTPDDLLMEMPGGRKSEVAGQLTAYATLLLGNQFRTHTFLVFIVRDYARLIRWDRSGAVVTERFQYDEVSYLLQFLVRYNYAGRDVCGHDETISKPTTEEQLGARRTVNELKDVEHLVTVAINNQRYVIRAPSAQPEIPVGRWTRTSIAYDCQSKKRVFLKDSWRVLRDGIHPEGEIYDKLQQAGVRNIPHCIDSGDIGNQAYHTTESHNFLDCTRDPTSTKITPHRHYRLVLDTVGRKLHRFRRSKDMVSAILASLIAHEQAFLAGVLHRDISAGNIMIVDESHPNIEHGMLIDWDHSKMVGPERSARQHARTGTWLFMAAELIQYPNTPQTFVHDLESAFWVLIWVVVSYMHTDVDAADRSSLLKDQMSPKVYDQHGGGARAKMNFIRVKEVPQVTGVQNISTLLYLLANLFAHRYPVKEPELPQNDDINHLANRLGLEKADKAGNTGDQKANDAGNTGDQNLKDHSFMISTFKAILGHDGWPEDDKARLQPKMLSLDEKRGMRAGSKESRSVAEENGVFVVPPP